MLNMNRYQRYGLSVLSGILLALSFPFIGGLTPLVFIALVPLLMVDYQITRNRFRSGKVLIHAYITFFLYNLLTTWWIVYADENGAVMAVLFNAALMTAAFYGFHFVKRHLGKKRGYIGLLFIWIGFEYAHFHWELSWPWLTLGNVFSNRVTWVQWYSYSGVFGGTLWILLINLLIFRIIENRFVKRESWNIQFPLIVLTGLGLLLPIAISVWMYISKGEEKARAIEVVVAQPNIDPYTEKFSGMSNMEQLDLIWDEVKRKATVETDLILAPETSIAYPMNEAQVNQSREFAFLASELTAFPTAELLIGASTYAIFEKYNSRASHALQDGPGFYENYNSSIFFNTNEETEIVHKSKLVLGVEKVPFSHWFPILEQKSIDLGGASGTLGVEKYPRVIRGSNATIAPVVCYESIYGEFLAEQIRQGAQLITIITNDGWWRDTPGYKQHCSFARLRAIETHRFVARSANTGTSCFINQRGDIIQQSAWWTKTALKDDVMLFEDQTFYTTYGDVLGRFFIFVSAMLFVFALVKKLRPTPQKSV